MFSGPLMAVLTSSGALRLRKMQGKFMVELGSDTKAVQGNGGWSSCLSKNKKHRPPF